MFRNVGINLGFRLIDLFLVSKITNQPLKNFVESQLDPLKDVAKVLTDSNPNDLEQLNRVWLENREQFVKDATQVLREIVEANVEDEDKRNLLLDIIEVLENELLSAFQNAE